MATIDTSLVREDLRRLCRQSKGTRNLVRDILEGIEDDPSRFPELRYVSEMVTSRFHNVVLRKAKVISKNRDYRIIFAHWTLADGREHADFLLVFPRIAGYEIDWEWITDVLDDPE